MATGQEIFVDHESELLKQFIFCYLYSPASLRPNTTPKFRLVDPSYPLLKQSPSPFHVYVWATFLHPYKGVLTSQLILILRFGAFIGYQGPGAYIVSCNLFSALLNPDVIQQKLKDNLLAGCVIPATQITSFISSPLGLVPKPNEDLRRIYHLSFPHGSSVNNFIPKEAANLKYATLENILARIRRAGRGATIMKKDIKDAFRNIPVAPHQQWLLGFQ